jgi:hypothetical protein
LAAGSDDLAGATQYLLMRVADQYSVRGQGVALCWDTTRDDGKGCRRWKGPRGERVWAVWPVRSVARGPGVGLRRLGEAAARDADGEALTGGRAAKSVSGPSD